MRNKAAQEILRYLRTREEARMARLRKRVRSLPPGDALTRAQNRIHELRIVIGWLTGEIVPAQPGEGREADRGE